MSSKEQNQQHTTSKTPKRRIAITGINGFPGAPFLAWLDQTLAEKSAPLADKYDEIVALDIRPPKTKLEKTRFHKIDLTQPAIDQKIASIFKEENVDAVIHLAFQYSPTKKSSYEHELHSIGTMYLLNACAAQKIKKIIIGSTTSCYGAFPNNPNFMNETHPLRGGEQAPFIRDYVDVERQVLHYQKTHPEAVVTVLRPCATVGEHIQNFTTRYLCRNVCLTPLGFDPLIQLVHEDDVVQAFQLAIENDCRGAYNVVGEGVLPLLTLLQMGGRVVLPIAHSLLYPMMQLFWQMDVGTIPPSYLNFLRYLWVADGSKAEKELGFSAKYSTREAALSFFSRERLKQVHLAE